LYDAQSATKFTSLEKTMMRDGSILFTANGSIVHDYWLWSIFFPAQLFFFIAYCSLWFDINQMMPRVAVTVIAMLTFTTAEANIRRALPMSDTLSWGQWMVTWDMMLMVYIMVCHAMAHRRKWLQGQGKPKVDYTSRIVVLVVHILGTPMSFALTDNSTVAVLSCIALSATVITVYVTGFFFLLSCFCDLFHLCCQCVASKHVIVHAGAIDTLTMCSAIDSQDVDAEAKMAPAVEDLNGVVSYQDVVSYPEVEGKIHPEPIQ
jgi:hypothetical protein